jgi:hypothetical protein
MSAKTSAIAGAWSAFGESHYRRGDCDSLHPRLVGRIISWKQHSESECLGLVARKGRYTIVWQKIRCTLRLTLKRDLDLVPLQKCSTHQDCEVPVLCVTNVTRGDKLACAATNC